MKLRITALLSSSNMKVRDFKSKISCCFNSECDVEAMILNVILIFKNEFDSNSSKSPRQFRLRKSFLLFSIKEKCIDTSDTCK